MKEVEVQLSNNAKHYVGSITGLDGQYGFALDFLPLRAISRTYHKCSITAPGTYKLTPGATVASRRIDTGYITVAADGEVAEIQKADAIKLFAQ